MTPLLAGRAGVGRAAGAIGAGDARSGRATDLAGAAAGAGALRRSIHAARRIAHRDAVGALIAVGGAGAPGRAGRAGAVDPEPVATTRRPAARARAVLANAAVRAAGDPPL